MYLVPPSMHSRSTFLPFSSSSAEGERLLPLPPSQTGPSFLLFFSSYFLLARMDGLGSDLGRGSGRVHSLRKHSKPWSSKHIAGRGGRGTSSSMWKMESFIDGITMTNMPFPLSTTLSRHEI